MSGLGFIHSFHCFNWDCLNLFFLLRLSSIVEFLCFSLIPLNGFINFRIILSRFLDWLLLYNLFIYVFEIIFLDRLDLLRYMLSFWRCFTHWKMIRLNLLTCTPQSKTFSGVFNHLLGVWPWFEITRLSFEVFVSIKPRVLGCFWQHERVLIE